MIYLFDFDGVLNKSEYFSIQYEKDFKVPKSKFDNFFKNEFDQCALKQADIKDILPKYFPIWNWSKSVDEFLIYWFSNDIKIDYDLIRQITNLKNKNDLLLIVSQQEIHRKTHIWNDLKLNTYFDHFFSSCDIGYLKDNPLFYLEIKKIIKKKFPNNRDEKIYFWDDSKNFIEASKQTDIIAKHFKNNLDILKLIKSNLDN